MDTTADDCTRLLASYLAHCRTLAALRNQARAYFDATRQAHYYGQCSAFDLCRAELLWTLAADRLRRALCEVSTEQVGAQAMKRFLGSLETEGL